MQTWYPLIKPYARHDLAVDDTHTLYVDESGSPEGLPVVFIHGGPGSGCDAQSRCYFDPNLYRIVTFDQRGCGRSTPHAELTDNTTWHLVQDIELLRSQAAPVQRDAISRDWNEAARAAMKLARQETVQ